MRLFVAIPLPEDIGDGLSRICAGVPGAKWVAPENLHITLRFIGEVDGGAFHDIAAALARVLGSRHLVLGDQHGRHAEGAGRPIEA